MVLKKITNTKIYKFGHRFLAHSTTIKPFLYSLIFLIPPRFRLKSHVSKVLFDYHIKAKGKDKFFINIGSNDGVSGDPLYEYVKRFGWSGICVEPVPFVFNRLKKNYKKFRNVKLVNAAIGSEYSTEKFYYLAENEMLKSGYDQIGSFDLKHVEKHVMMFPGLKKYITSLPVNVLRFDSLVQPNQNIDVLLIDTEGFDVQIINSIDFNRNKINLIIFETIHAAPNELEALFNKLAFKYHIVDDGFNAICIKKGD